MQRSPYEADGLGDLPHLSEMVQTALEILDNDPDGLFLMIEGGRIDHAAQLVFDWAKDRIDTLIVVTADHETGGLEIVANKGIQSLPEVTWSTTGHTNQDIPVYAWGVNAHQVFGVAENSDIFRLLSRAAFLD